MSWQLLASTWACRRRICHFFLSLESCQSSIKSPSIMNKPVWVCLSSSFPGWGIAEGRPRGSWVVMGGGCGPGSETPAGSRSEVLARTPKQWHWRGRQTPRDCDSPRKVRDPLECGRWLENQTSQFCQVRPFCQVMLHQLWLENNRAAFIICPCVTAMVASDGSEYQVYDSMLLIRFSVLVNIWALPHSWQSFYVESFWLILLGLFCGLDGITCGGMTWPHCHSPLCWFGLGLVGYGCTPCELGLSWMGLGIKTRAHSLSTNLKFSNPY